MRWDGQTTLRSRVFTWLLGGMGKLLFVFSYSSGYEVGSANHSQKSRIQVTIWWDGQINLRILVFKWKWVGMGKPLSGVSYLSDDYEVGWANHTKKSRIQVTMRGDGQITLRSSRIQVTMRWDGQTTLRSLVFKWLWGGMGKSLLEFSYSSDYEVGWANHS